MRKLRYALQDQWETEERETQSPILIESSSLEAKKNTTVYMVKDYLVTEVHKNFNSLSLKASGEIKSEKRYFQLDEVHFHHPAEHCFEGEDEPRVLEAHFVHYGSLKQPLVVSVTFKLGAKNAIFQKVLDAMDDNDDGEIETSFFLDELIPKQGNFYRYIGSLTTPPLTEGVEWLVFEEAQTIDSKQLDQYVEVFLNHNSRKLQKLNNRIVEKYKI
jgi:carbonic anhydrase